MNQDIQLLQSVCQGFWWFGWSRTKYSEHLDYEALQSTLIMADTLGTQFGVHNSESSSVASSEETLHIFTHEWNEMSIVSDMDMQISTRWAVSINLCNKCILNYELNYSWGWARDM